MTISFESKGNFSKSTRWLEKLSKGEFFKRIDSLAAKGTSALSAATPVETGKTSNSWSHKTTVSGTSAKIEWTNSNTNGGVNIAIILQYGHGTGTGGYVAGRDYINPAMRPVFKEIEEAVWKEVTSLG